MYEKFSKKSNEDMISASGIPALRSFCYTITAEKQLLEAKHFLKTRLPTLLNSMEIWIDNDSQEQQTQSESKLMAERKQKAYTAIERSKTQVSLQDIGPP
jgi:hypothetical protein